MNADAKTSKGSKKGFLTGILYMAPYTVAGGANMCPMAEKAGCHKACLYSAGRGKFSNVQAGRIRKAQLFQNDFKGFMDELTNDISKVIRKAERENLTPVIRLNGTSDILWERKNFTLSADVAKRVGVAAGNYNNIFEVFPDIQFYDYTKISGRFASELPENYDLTFSYSAVSTYQKQVENAFKFGARVAVVFREAQPETWQGLPVVNGDETDLRFLEKQGVIVALKAKGDGKNDTSGFVVDYKPEVIKC